MKISVSKNLYVKESDKKYIVNKNNQQDNIIDLSTQNSPKRFIEELTQDENKTNARFLKLDKNTYIDLNSSQGKELLNNIKSLILNDNNEFRKEFLRMDFSESTGINIETTIDNPQTNSDENIEKLDLLNEKNKDVSKILKQLDQKNSSFGIWKISKEDIASFMIDGKVTTNISAVIDKLDKTGEWSALNVMIELNKVRKAYLESEFQDIESQISEKTNNLKLNKNPDDIKKINSDLEILENEKGKLNKEIENINNHISSMGIPAMEKRISYSKTGIAISKTKIDVLAKQIKELESQMAEKDPKIEAKIQELQKKYSYLKSHMENLQKNLEHDAKFMDKLIADTKKNGGKVSSTYTKLATHTHTAAASGNVEIAKATIKERRSNSDNSSENVDSNLNKAKEHIKQIETYNPDFTKPIEKPKSDDAKSKKDYEEKIEARDSYLNLKTDIIKTDRSDKKDLLEKKGIKYDDISKQFINTKKDNNNVPLDLTHEQNVLKIKYKEAGIDLLKNANEQIKILKTEIQNDNPVNSDEEQKYIQKKAKIVSIMQDRRDVKTEFKNDEEFVQHSAKNYSSMENSLKVKQEELLQTRTGSEPDKKTKLDYKVSELIRLKEELSKKEEELKENKEDYEDGPDVGISSFWEDSGTKTLNELVDYQRSKQDVEGLQAQVKKAEQDVYEIYKKQQELLGNNIDPNQMKNFLSSVEKKVKLGNNILETQKNLKLYKSKAERIEDDFIERNTKGVDLSILKSTVNVLDKSLVQQKTDYEKATQEVNLISNQNNEYINEKNPPNSLNSAKLNKDKAEIAKRQAFSNENTLRIAATNKGIPLKDISLDKLAKDIKTDLYEEESFIDETPGWAKENKNYQAFKAQALYNVANAKSSMSSTYTFIDTEKKHLELKEKSQKISTEINENNTSVNPNSRMTNKAIEEMSERVAIQELENIEPNIKQGYDLDAIKTLEKAEKARQEFKKVSKNEDDETNIKLIQISVRTNGKIALNIVNNRPDETLRLLERNSKTTDEIDSTKDYIMQDGTVINGLELNKTLHDENARITSRAVEPAMKVNSDPERIKNNISRVTKSGQNLLNLSIKEANKVKTLEKEEIKKSEEKLSTLPKGSKEYEKEAKHLSKLKEQFSEFDNIKKVYDEISSSIKKSEEKLSTLPKGSKEYEKEAKHLSKLKERFSEFDKQEMSGSTEALLGKVKIDERNIKGAEGFSKLAEELKKEKAYVMTLYKYNIDQVKYKSQDHPLFSLVANRFSSKFDTDNLDDIQKRIGEEYDRKIAEAESRAKNYQEAIKNDNALEYISTLKMEFSLTKNFNDTHDKMFNTPEPDNSTITWIKNGGPIENNDFENIISSTKYNTGSLMEGGYESGLDDVNEMNRRFSDRKLTEMFGTDTMYDLDTGWNFLDDTANSTRDFFNRPETLQMIVEFVITEVATAGLGSGFAAARLAQKAGELGLEAIEIAKVSKSTAKLIESAVEAKRALQGAEEILNSAKAALNAAKETKNLINGAEKIFELEQNLKKAQELYDIAKISQIEKYADLSNSLKNTFELAEQSKAMKFIDHATNNVKTIAAQNLINISAEKIFGEDSDITKAIGLGTQILFGHSSEIKGMKDLFIRIAKNFGQNVAQHAITTLASNLYALEKFGKINNLTEEEKKEAELFGNIFSHIKDITVSASKEAFKTKPTKEAIIHENMGKLVPNIHKDSQVYKEISKSLEDFHELSKTNPEKAKEKLSEIIIKVDEHYTNSHDTVSKTKAHEYVQHETADLIISQIKEQNKDLTLFTENIKKHLEEHNKQNPELKIDKNVIEKVVELQKQKKVSDDIKTLGNDTLVNDFETHMVNLSKVNNKASNSAKNEIEISVNQIINSDLPNSRKKELIEKINNELSGTLQRREQQLETYNFVKGNYANEIHELKNDIKKDPEIIKNIENIINKNKDVKKVFKNPEQFIESIGKRLNNDEHLDAFNKINEHLNNNNDFTYLKGEIERINSQLGRTEKGINSTEFDRVAEYSKAIQRNFGDPKEYKGYNKLIYDVIQSNSKFKEAFPTLESFHIATVSNPVNMSEKNMKALVEIRHEMDNRIFDKDGKAIFIKLSAPGNEGKFEGFVLPAEAVKGLTIEKLAQALNLDYTGSKYYDEHGNLKIKDIKVNISEVSRDELDIPFSTEFDKHIITEHSKPEIKEGGKMHIAGIGNKKHLLMFNFPFSGSSLLPGKILESAALPESTIKPGIKKEVRIMSLDKFHNELNNNVPLMYKIPSEKIDKLKGIEKGSSEKLSKAYESLPAKAKQFTANEITKIVNSDIPDSRKVELVNTIIKEANLLSGRKAIFEMGVEKYLPHLREAHEKLKTQQKELENEIEILTKKEKENPSDKALKIKLKEAQTKLEYINNKEYSANKKIKGLIAGNNEIEITRYQDIIASSQVKFKNIDKNDFNTNQVNEIIKNKSFTYHEGGNGKEITLKISDVVKSLEDYHILVKRHPSELTEQQWQATKAIREAQHNALFEDPQTGKIDPNKEVTVIRVDIAGKEGNLKGFVLDPRSIKEVTDFNETIEVLRLDYPGSDFVKNTKGEGYIHKDTGAVITQNDIKITVGRVKYSEVEIPYISAFGGPKDALANVYPMTGHGVLAGVNKIGKPEMGIKRGVRKTDINTLSFMEFIRRQQSGADLMVK